MLTFAGGGSQPMAMAGGTRQAADEVMASIVQTQDIVLAHPSDLTVTVVSPEQDGIKYVTDFETSKACCNKSSYLRTMTFGTSDHADITLDGQNGEGEDVRAVHVYLACLHGLSPTDMKGGGLHNVSTATVWHLIRLIDTYGSAAETSSFQAWFAEWFQATMANMQLDLDAARELALPCAFFGHVSGFAQIT